MVKEAWSVGYNGVSGRDEGISSQFEGLLPSKQTYTYSKYLNIKISVRKWTKTWDLLL